MRGIMPGSSQEDNFYKFKLLFKMKSFVKTMLACLSALFSLVSCTLFVPGERTPEYIISRVWGINVVDLEHSVCAFEDQWCPKGDGSTFIKMKVSLPDDYIEFLMSAKGGKPLPIPEGTIMQKSWIEEKVGTDIDSISDGVYFYEQGNPSLTFECMFLLYDRESEMLYYYVNIM